MESVCICICEVEEHCASENDTPTYSGQIVCISSLDEVKFMIHFV